MTEQERSELLAAKEAVTQRLASKKIPAKVSRCDKRISQYIREVARYPHKHNLWEQLAVCRFLDMVDKYGLNARAVCLFFSVYESLYFPGKLGERTYKLTPIQAFQFASIFGFWEGDRRIVREVVLYVPRKYSKTTSTAALAVYDLLFGDANAEAYVGANSQDQAKKCFDVIRGAMRRLDPQGRRFVVNEDIIKSRIKGRTAIAQCLTATAKTKDGLNASTVIMDEFSQARDNRLLTVLTTSMGVRDNPLTVIITTASDLYDGPFFSMLEGYKALLLGKVEDDSTFAHLFEPDVDDAEDSEATWRKVHPHMGVTVSLDFYRREYNTALRNGAEAMLAFRTKLLNIYATSERNAWISAEAVRDVMRPLKYTDLHGRPMGMVAYDLSESQDLTAVTLGIYDSATKSNYYFTDYFFPEGALPGNINERLFRMWAASGHLHLTPGSVVDYRMVADHIFRLNEYAQVLSIGYDSWRSKTLCNMLDAGIRARHGDPSVLKPISQTPAHFTAACEMFEHGLKTGHVYMNDNPINAYCFGNAVLDIDRMGNCKPTWRQEAHKIDGVITMLMSQKLFLDYYG